MKYKCYEENYPSELSLKEWESYYESEINKTEYPDFECWWSDMKRTGLIVESEEVNYEN